MQDKIEVPPLPTGGTDKGAVDMAADLMTTLTAAPEPTKPAESEPKPEEKPAGEKPAEAPEKPAEKPKPAPKPAAAKQVEPPKPAAKPAAKPDTKPVDFDDPKISAPELRKHLKDLSSRLDTTTKEKEKTVRDLQSQIDGFKQKRFWTEDDQKLLESAQKRLTEAESRLHAVDYTQSPEYLDKYKKRLDEIWKTASEEVVGLQVLLPPVEGEEQKYRPANSADLLQVVDAPATQRMAIAKKLFGDDRDTVLGWAREIDLIRREASRAVAEKQSGYEKTMKERAAQDTQTQRQLQEFIHKSTESLAQKFPDIFAPPEDDPEAADALKRGFQFVDEFVNKQGEMNINEKAARTAIIRAQAAAYPRLVHDVRKLRAEVERLTSENAKLLGQDPANMGGEGGGGEAPADDGGTDKMAEEIGKLG